jgi:secreted trypsin-like serine protease
MRNRRRGAVALLVLGLLTAMLATAPRAEATNVPQPKIIGGDPAEPGEYPFMAALLDETIAGDDYQKQYCGGALIAANWVLTAAHCVEGESASSLAVAVGRNQLNNSSQGARRSVAAIFVHPQYGSPTSFAHDAALLQLSSSITTIAPIRLAGAGDDGFEAAGTILTVIGWGNVKTTGTPSYPNDLQEVDVPVVSDANCAKAYGSSLDAPTMLCAGAAGLDSCQGDSGGPLFATSGTSRIQMGIVSWGNGCAKKRFPGVYSEVNNPDIRSWITATSGV